MQMLMEGITLSDAQKTKVDSIVASYQAKMPAMTPGTPPTDEQRAERMKLMTERTAAIKTVLTPEQVKQFDTNMEGMRSRMGGGGRPPAER
jgi:Spy/CpxP family protein refolding chaperone